MHTTVLPTWGGPCIYGTYVVPPVVEGLMIVWKTGEDGPCCSGSAIQTWLGPSSLLEEWSEIPIVFVVSFVLSATPQTGGNGQGI